MVRGAELDMYDNIRKEMCKKINEMYDADLLLFFARLAVTDVEVLARIVNFSMLKEEADELEADLEKGKEDVK